MPPLPGRPCLRAAVPAGGPSGRAGARARHVAAGPATHPALARAGRERPGAPRPDPRRAAASRPGHAQAGRRATSTHLSPRCPRGGPRTWSAVEVDGQRLDILAEDAPSLSDAEGTGVVRLLGPFDLFLQGRDRDLVVPDAAARKDLWRTIGRPGGVLAVTRSSAAGARASGKKLGSRSSIWDGGDPPAGLDERRSDWPPSGACRSPGTSTADQTRSSQIRSRISAMPWPPPTHMVIRPVDLSCQSRRVEHRVLEPGAGHAERVADRDRAAVDVEPVEVDAEVLVRRHHLRRERLVDLDQVDVADAHARVGERPLAWPRPGRGP